MEISKGFDNSFVTCYSLNNERSITVDAVIAIDEITGDWSFIVGEECYSMNCL